MTETVIVPDDKDWTWVVGRACPECGADVPSISAESVAQEIRDNVNAWAEILRRDPGELRRRRAPTGGRPWSTPLASATSTCCTSNVCG